MEKINKTPLQNVQHDPTELERCQKDPVYFYNKYIRKESEKVLTKKEYERHVKAIGEFRKEMPIDSLPSFGTVGIDTDGNMFWEAPLKPKEDDISDRKD